MLRSPNYTEYLNSLNSASPLDEDPFNTEGLDLQSLEMFTNANFTHHDMIPEEPFSFDMNNDSNVKYGDLLSNESTQPTFNPPTVDSSPGEGPFYSNYNTPIQPAPSHSFPALESQSSPQQSGSGSRRKAEPVQTQGLTSEEKSRIAAEEDKRRRNTAASARFRVKKKQREQALERTVKEVNDKNTKLEAKINQLEMENKWLKDLITEKNAMQSREELEHKYLEFKRESEERDSEHTTGVGTE
ncbi:hypothetical protein DV736_g408, partial [Chaetothyriales sp. CBS 134916]